MPPKPPLDPTQLKQLRDDLDLIHLLFHRNKNQHRLLKWWQWIATLRRNLSKLLFEHDLITAAKTTPNRNAAVANYEARLAFMRRVVVPSAYAAFGTVIAMKSFAPLGLVLTGVLARVWVIIRPTEGELKAAEATQAATMAALDAEMGVVVSREAYAESDRGAAKSLDRNEKISMTDALRELSSREKEEEGEKKKTKKKKKKDNSKNPGSTGAKPTEKERTGAPQATPAPVEKTSKRKPDAEPEAKKRKKKKEDDLDALFNGLF